MFEYLEKNANFFLHIFPIFKPLFFKSVQIYMKVAECAETSEKYIFPISFDEFSR